MSTVKGNKRVWGHMSNVDILWDEVSSFSLACSRRLVILVPKALFASLSWQGLGTRNKGLWGHGISFVYAVLMFLYSVWESHGGFTSALALFQQPIKN